MADSTSSHTVQALLLQEAQQEIASLRTDLYNTRRLAEERRQAVVSLTSANQQLAGKVVSLESVVANCQAELEAFRGIDVQLATVRESSNKLQQELQLSIRARKILEGELSDERRQRLAVEEAKAVVESERSRLQRARDELAAQVRLAQHRVKEAEEEQVRAEEELTALRSELESAYAQLQNRSMQGSGSHAQLSTMSRANSDMFDNNPASAAAATSNLNAAIEAATAPLMEQLEYERSRAATLLSSLQAAKAEVGSLQARLHSAGGGMQEVESLRTHVVSLRSELEQATHRSHALQQQLQQKTQELAAAQQAVTAATAAAAAAAAKAAAIPHNQPTAPSHTPLLPHHPGSAPPPAPPPVNLGTPCPYDSTQPSPHAASHPRDPHPPTMTASSSLHNLLNMEPASGSEGTTLVSTAQLERLQAQVIKLKQSRDKLLEEIDSQWEEMDRLATDNKQLTEEVERTRRLAAGWEVQAQESLAQVDKLKDLLEESASWSAQQSSAAAAGADPAGKAGAGAGAGGPGDAASRLHALQQEMLAEKARVVDLEVQVRALAAELLRSQHANVALGRSVLPVLSGIELRLGDMCGKASKVVKEMRSSAVVVSGPAAYEDVAPSQQPVQQQLTHGPQQVALVTMPSAPPPPPLMHAAS